MLELQSMREVEPRCYELTWAVSGDLELDKVEENARRVRAKAERGNGALTVVYEGRDRTVLYEFTRSRVKARIKLPEPVESLEKLAESQRKIVTEVYLKDAIAGQTPAGEAALEAPQLTSFQKLIVDTARRLFEEEGVPPSARRLARELGYASPTPIYRRAGLSLQQIYQLAGIPSEVRAAPPRPTAEPPAAAREPRPAARPRPEPWSPPEPLEPPADGARLEGRVLSSPGGPVIEAKTTVEVGFLDRVVEKVDLLPLDAPIEVKTKWRVVRIAPYPDGTLGVEFWRIPAAKKPRRK